MNKIIGFELKKLFSDKTLIFIVILLLFTDAFYICRRNNDYFDKYNSASSEAEYTMYTTAEGEITGEKISALENYSRMVKSGDPSISNYYYNAYYDGVVTDNILSGIRTAAGYEGKMNTLMRSNEELAAIYENCGNDYLKKQTEIISDIYSARALSNFYDMRPAEKYIGYDFSSLLIIMIVFFACAPIFAGEKESSAMSLILSSPKGRVPLCAAKQLTAVIFTSVVCALFFVCDFLVFLWRVRFRGLGEPVYSMQSFEFSPLNISVIGLVVVLLILKYLGVLCFTMLACAFSSVFDRSYMAFLASVLTCFGLMVVSAYSGGAFEYINAFNPINVIIGRNLLSDFYVINIFGEPVFKYVIYIAGTAFFAVLLSAASFAVNNPNTVSGRSGK